MTGVSYGVRRTGSRAALGLVGSATRSDYPARDERARPPISVGCGRQWTSEPGCSPPPVNAAELLEALRLRGIAGEVSPVPGAGRTVRFRNHGIQIATSRSRRGGEIRGAEIPILETWPLPTALWQVASVTLHDTGLAQKTPGAAPTVTCRVPAPVQHPFELIANSCRNADLPRHSAAPDGRDPRVEAKGHEGVTTPELPLFR